MILQPRPFLWQQHGVLKCFSTQHITFRISILLLMVGFFSACGVHKRHKKFIEKEQALTIPKIYKSDLDSSQIAVVGKYDTFPRQVNLKPFQTAVKDQDSRSTCAFFTFCGMLESYYIRKYGKTFNLSEEYLIGLAKGEFYGVSENCELGVPVGVFTKYGIVTETRWPYQPTWFTYGFPYHGLDENNMPEKKFKSNIPPPALHQNELEETYYMFQAKWGLYKTIQYLAKDSLPMVGILILTYDQYLHCDSTGEVKKTTYSDARNVNMGTGEFTYDIPKTYKIIGRDTLLIGDIPEDDWQNHFVLITGYDLEEGRIYFKNSWGLSFGDSGYGFITISEFTEHVRYSLFINHTKYVIPFPKDTASPEANVQVSDLLVTANTGKSGALNINLLGQIQGSSQRIAIVNHNLYAMDKMDNTGNDYSKAKAVTLGQEDSVKFEDKYVRCTWHTPSESIGTNLVWTNNNPLTLSIPDKKIKALLSKPNSSDMSYVLRTQITVYSDNQGMVKLNETWTPVNLTGVNTP